MPNAPLAASLPTEPAVLIAGCGTGEELLSLASRVAKLRIAAIDLSRSSLAYAMRMAGALKIDGIEFRQADILTLGEGWGPFDIICSSGVLHHFHDPSEGLRALVQRLRPGGLIKLGLYSERGRHTIRRAREQIATERIPTTVTGIRAFRMRVLRSKPSDQLHWLLRTRDFFTLSECRDLLFHVKEHAYGLPTIADMVRNEGLQMLGLSRQLPRGALAEYRKAFPKDGAANDLERWDEVEINNPDVFGGMYHFWCQKPPPH